MKNTSSQAPISFYQHIRGWLGRRFALVTLAIIALVIVVSVLWSRIFITVESGEAAILFKRFSGTQIDRIYEEGFHVFFPWNIVYVYEVRKQVAFHDFDVLSNKGLIINLSLAVRYRPEYDLLGILHKQIGPDYLSRVILPQIESVMRKQLGDYSAEQIYTNEEGLLTNAILTALDEVGRNYVEVEDIIIRSIRLPDTLVKAIEEKLRQEEFMKSYEFRLQTAEKEAERLKIEATGIAEHHRIIDESLSENILRHKGINATKELAQSANAKIVVIGGGRDGLPLILNTADQPPTPSEVASDTPGAGPTKLTPGAPNAKASGAPQTNTIDENAPTQP